MHLVALGANLPSPRGGPRDTLEAALAALEMHGISVVSRSAWYRTPAFPPGSGPDYVNGAAMLDGAILPTGLLRLLHTIEADLGRIRGQRWAPRACDLDLLASGGAVHPDAATVSAWIGRAGAAQAEAPPGLVLPHPRMQDRGFVLVPLAEVAPEWRHPLLGRTVREMLEALPAAAQAGISRLDPA